jgi:hypothetical protein
MTRAAVTDVSTLQEAIRRGYRPDYLMFWGHHAEPGAAVGKECLSQWWPSGFEIEGHRYSSAEHFMMAQKAHLFGDHEIRDRILLAPGPSVAKQLGRQVRGFDEPTWAESRFAIVVRGNLAKFQQHPALAAFLAGTEDRVLVEASPSDRIWGIGMVADAPDADKPEKWRGLNLLGFALMEVRRVLAGGIPDQGLG